jgi:putative addiction module killer protein
LRDDAAIARVQARIDRLALGNFGDCKPIKGPVQELRIDYGPGYRLYIMRQGSAVIVLLAGGTKRTQAADIRRALIIAKEWKGKS